MRFSVDAHAIGRHLTGNEVYIRNLLEGFAALDTTSEFIAYVSAPEAAAYVPSRFQVRAVPRNPLRRLGYGLTRQVRRDRPSLLHVQYTSPLACPVPVVVSVHDVSFIEHPEYFPPLRRAQLLLTVRRTVERAAAVLTPSEFSRRAVLDAYRLDPARVHAIPNAASETFRPLPREAAAAWVRRRFGIAAPYVLTVGDLQPRKNQLGLIAAFEELLREVPRLTHHLILAGQDTWFSRRVRQAAERSPIADRIHFTGWVSDEELLQLYAGCDALVFPSHYEGFGLPILEAMACGRAVACSDTSAMPEVADGAALLFDPRSRSQIVRAMKDLLLDADLRARMERLGQQRATRFSWKPTAARTLEVYHRVAEPDRSRSAQSARISTA